MKARRGSGVLSLLFALGVLSGCQRDDKATNSQETADVLGLHVERYIELYGNGIVVESHNTRPIRLERIVLNGKVGVLGCDSDEGLAANQDRRAPNYLNLVFSGIEDAKAAIGDVFTEKAVGNNHVPSSWAFLTNRLTVKNQVLADGYALHGLAAWRTAFIRALLQGERVIFAPPAPDSCGYEIKQIDIRTDRGPVSIRRAADLSEAARADDRPRVQELISTGAKLNEFTHDEETALAEAAGGGHLQIVQALLAAKADLNAQDPNGDGGDTALIVAAQNAQAAAVRTLIAAKADVNAQGFLGTTALIEASRHGRLDIVRALLVAGADVNLGTNAAGNPLRAAAEYGWLEVARLLLTAGARVDDPHILKAAVENGHADIADLLRSHGATETYPDENAAPSGDENPAATQQDTDTSDWDDDDPSQQDAPAASPQPEATGTTQPDDTSASSQPDDAGGSPPE